MTTHAPFMSPPAIEVERIRVVYLQAAAKEGPAITRPNVTADFVTRLHAADQAARAALVPLERGNAVPSPAAVQSAKAAVQALQAILQEAPA